MPHQNDLIIACDPDGGLCGVFHDVADKQKLWSVVTKCVLEAEKHAAETIARLVILSVPARSSSHNIDPAALYDACARIRRLPHYGSVPILLLAPEGNADRQHAAARKAGANSLVFKPVSFADLNGAAGSLLIPGTVPGLGASVHFTNVVPVGSRRTISSPDTTPSSMDWGANNPRVETTPKGFGEPKMQEWARSTRLEWHFGQGSALRKGIERVNLLRKAEGSRGDK